MGSQEQDDADQAAARARIDQQGTWVDLQIRSAMARGDFDDLPGSGRPIPDLGSEHDPDWWLKRLIEREKVTGVLPPALQLRVDDARLDDVLDRLASASEVRREIEEFNARVIRARYTPVDGPPLITMPRDVEAPVAGWAERRAAVFRRPADETVGGTAKLHRPTDSFIGRLMKRSQRLVHRRTSHTDQ